MTSIDRWKQPGVAKSVTSSMNNFLDSVDAMSTKSQAIDEHPRDSDVKSESSRRSSKQFVERDLTASFDKHLSDNDASQNNSNQTEQLIDYFQEEKPGSNEKVNDNLNNGVSDNTDTQNENTAVTDISTEGHTVTELSQGDGSVVC